MHGEAKPKGKENGERRMFAGHCGLGKKVTVTGVLCCTKMENRE
jgi:hypothetical protein